MRSLIEPIVVPLVKFAARSYVAGSQIEDAVVLAKAAQQRGFSCTLCYWNASKEDPAIVLDYYTALLDGMREAQLDSYLAVKIPALWNRYDDIARIVERARSQGTRVVFDAHAPEQATTTFKILKQIGGDGVGCAIPGRWRRSLEDVERAIELGISVRVVKGQWPDPEEPNMDLREGYLRIIDGLAGRASHVGIATHDHLLLREAIHRLRSTGTYCEQELVYPLPVEKARAEALQAGLTSRLYIPFGTSWVPYSISRALKNPIIFYWLLRDLVLNRHFTLPRRPTQVP